MSNLIGFGLGSNLGDRVAFLAQATQRIGALLPGSTLRLSPLYETAALLPEGADASWDTPYLNQVAVVRTDCLASPEALLAGVKAAEREIGRQARGHWAPREIDIDVLFVGAELRNAPELTLPHAQMHRRAFVMLPLADIAPDWEHPLLKKTAAALARRLPEEGIRRYEG